MLSSEIYRNYNSPPTSFNYAILLTSIVFSTSYLNKTISKSDVFDSTSLDRSRLLTPRKTPSPKPPIRDVSRQLKNLGRLVARWNRDIKLPGARRGRLKIEQANHRADFAPHKLSREGRAILLAKRPTPGDAFARELWLCNDSATRWWSAYRFVISTSKSFSNPFYLRFIRYYFVLLTSAEQRDGTWASERRYPRGAGSLIVKRIDIYVT